MQGRGIVENPVSIKNPVIARSVATKQSISRTVQENPFLQVQVMDCFVVPRFRASLLAMTVFFIEKNLSTNPLP